MKQETGFQILPELAQNQASSMNPVELKMKMMKRLIQLFIFLVAGYAGFSQQYNNEWIDFSKTYYKFKVGKTGLYRIPQTTLAAAGLGGISADQFKLIRNGIEVPIYTSNSGAPLTGGGYIEFWGEANDGKADQPLYRDPAYQHTNKISLQTDTAMFFLTASSGTNLRLTEQANDVAGTSLSAESYFMYTAGNYYRARINPGFSRNAGEYVYSSSYDRGEYWSSAELKPGPTLSSTLSGLAVYAGGPNPTFRFGASGNTQNNRTITARLNNTQVYTGPLNLFQDINTDPQSFSLSLITGNSATVAFSNTSDNVNDRLVVSYYEITYPRKFDFGGSKNFSFELPAKSEGYLLSITNFVKGAERPVLYDLTNGHRFPAVYSTVGDSLKFVLPAAQARKLVLVNEEASNVNSVTSLTPKQFINYSDPANQGDYLIISNPVLYQGTGGSNPVFAYRDYRKSSAGGSYNATVIDINELIDQFAFGIKKHPLSIKNFLRYAREKFSVTPKYVFLIGRGVDYVSYRGNESDLLADQINLVPTFGYPASDNMLSSSGSTSPFAVTPIGRLSVISGNEVEIYLQKVKEYEYAQLNAGNTITDRLWMKNVMEVTGASQSELGTTLCNFMHEYKDLLTDTNSAFGANVHLFCKSSANPVEQLSNSAVSDLFKEGLSFLNYFGHSSSSTLEFNINNPEFYENAGKYPVFSVNGCNAGNFFTFSKKRLQVFETLSEIFVLAKERGAIAFIASTHFGIVNYLNIYIDALYTEIGQDRYGGSLGEILAASLKKMVDANVADDFYARLHAEEITLHGDPALKLNVQLKPDYVVEDAQVRITPSFISIAEDDFKVDVRLFNLGRAVKDSVMLEIKRQYPDGSTEILYKDKRKPLTYSDSISLQVPVIGTRDKGSNKIIVSIDSDNSIDEIDETNNIITKEIFIYEDEARPASPFNNAIVNKQGIKMYASTADPLSMRKDYVMEIDTTAAFNSALKITRNASSTGGIIEFDPGLVFLDSVVYYWRVALVPAAGGEYHWNTASFIYIKDGPEGFNQSHYYQLLNSSFQDLTLAQDRSWQFSTTTNNLFVRNTIFGTGGNQESDLIVDVNGNSDMIRSACVGTSLLFNVFDPVTFKPWKNVDENGNNLYIGGSGSANCYPSRNYNIEFSHTAVAKRELISRFMDSIPDGCYVVVRTMDYSSTSNATTWKNDPSTEIKKSLYDNLIAAGFADLDSYNKRRAFAFVYKKGSPDFMPRYVFTENDQDKLTLSVDCPTPDTIGYVSSQVFGPAKEWGKLTWEGRSLEPDNTDNPSIDVMGVDVNNNATLLYTVDRNTKSFDVSNIDPVLYPYLRLEMRNIDSVNLTPYQLDYWRVSYSPVPEGAISPNVYFVAPKDTLDLGEPLKFGVSFTNISAYPFDSIKIKATIIDNNNATHSIPVTKGKPLQTGDTLRFDLGIDTKDYPGNNIFSVNFNPDNDQAEQYLYNNFLYRNFYVRPDNTNPLMDVTFDGIHILNRDIVSSKPHIQIKIKDEAKYMLLNDTSVVKELTVRYPDENNTVKTYKFDGDTLRFSPAQNSSDNTAVIDFAPYFPAILDDSGEPFNPQGDDYELMVKAKDRSGNESGNIAYKVSFRVINKPMISNLLNYPNPFTTSTAFVFTITGSEIPQNLKIQILTVTGKVVREITKEELGPLNIGRNITEFKWNGTDQYGQRLANGVYLYRVVTTLNGKRMDKYKADNDDTDRYFNRGYGKMYLMR